MEFSKAILFLCLILGSFIASVHADAEKADFKVPDDLMDEDELDIGLKDGEYDDTFQQARMQRTVDREKVPVRLQTNTDNSLPLVNEENWYHTLDEHNNVLVMFTQSNSGCAECLAGEKIIAEVSKYENMIATEVLFVKLDCWEDLPICRKYGVEKQPSVKLFSQGTAIFDFKEHMITNAGILYFVNKYSAEKVRVVPIDEMEKTIDKSKTSTVVGFFDEASLKEAGSFNRTAAQLFPQGYLFLYVDLDTTDKDSPLLERYDVEPGTIHVFRKDRKAPVTYTGKVSRRRLSNWISEVAPQWVRESGGEWQDFVELGKPILCMWMDFTDTESRQKNVQILNEAVEEFKNKVTFIYDNGPLRPKVLERFGREDEGFPLVIYYDLQRKSVHVMEETNITAEAIETFTQRCLQLEVPAFQRTQKPPTPEDFEKAVVKPLVYSTFRQEAMDTLKDVLVLFYVPDSKPCQDFLPVWQEVGRRLAKVESLKIAMMDMEKNEGAPGHPVWSYPSVYAFNIGRKNDPILFSGPRDIDTVMNWIKNTVSAQFDFDELADGLNEEKNVV